MIDFFCKGTAASNCCDDRKSARKSTQSFRNAFTPARLVTPTSKYRENFGKGRKEEYQSSLSINGLSDKKYENCRNSQKYGTITTFSFQKSFPWDGTIKFNQKSNRIS